ncbi:MAG: hypothetical protein RSB57_03470 [Hungatella sp.]
MALILKLVIAVLCVVLIIWGQRTTGYIYLAAQLVGLSGLLGLLYLYNKAYR